MRAHIITTRSGRRRKARYSVLALALAVCALAIPATASASPVGGYSSANASTGGSSDSLQSDGGAVAAGNAHRTPTELAQTTGAGDPNGSSQPGGGAVATDHSSPNAIKGGHDVISGYASADAITGAEPFTGASGSSSGAEQWFDVPSALVGAGAAMALVALGGAAFLSVRRRTEVSPSASTS